MAVVRTHGAPATKVAEVGGLSEPRNSAPVSAMYKTHLFHVCRCMHTHVYVKSWGTPQVLSTLFFVTGFLTWPETCPIFQAGWPESLRNLPI